MISADRNNGETNWSFGNKVHPELIMHLCGSMLMGLILVIAMAVHTSEATSGKVVEYLSKVNGVLSACPVGDRNVVQQKGFNHVVKPWFEYVINETNVLLQKSGVNLRLAIPENCTEPMEIIQTLRLNFELIKKPDWTKVEDLYDANQAFWDAMIPLIKPNAGALYNQFMESCGCDLGILFIRGNDPMADQGRSAATTRGKLCTSDSHMTALLIGNADHTATLVAHELGHLLGLGHDEDVVTNMPWGMGSRPNDADGGALWDEVEDICVTNSERGEKQIMDPIPQYDEEETEYSECSKAHLAYLIYKNAVPERCLPRGNST